ncbi:MAG: MFS transporter [Pseudonocardiaceae bacterium]|nr:MFS transporter [Pseudonocardiaceae bacterium]
MSTVGTLWGHRDFTRLWAGETVSQFGSAVTLVALPLVAVTLLAASPFEVGLLTAAETAGFLLVGLPAGAWVDRIRRRPLMVWMDVVRAALLVTVPIAWWFGVLSLPQLLVVALTTGVATVFFDVAYQSYLPSLVGRPRLVEGNGKLETSRALANVTGPALGGGLVQLIGAATTLLADAISFAASALLLRTIRTVEPQPQRRERPDLRGEIVEGLRYVLRHPLLRAITACTGTANLFGGVVASMTVLFLSRELDLPAGVVGVLLALGGAGGLLGAVTASRWISRIGQARTIWLVPLLVWPVACLQPLARPGWGLALFVVGGVAFTYAGVVYNVAQVSFRQAVCPDRLLGRMNASIRFLVWGVLPLGGLLGGLLGELIGIRGTLAAGLIGHLAAAGWLLASPLRRLRDLPVDVAAV